MAERLRAFLADEGFGSLAAGLLFAHARQYSTVWTAKLLHPTGHAVLQLFVYDLAADPITVVDAHEERLALTELDSPLVPRLLGELFAPDLAILAVASASDAELLAVLRDSGQETLDIIYEPDLDRLVGVDHIHPLDGRWARTSLMSRSRAVSLAGLMQRLAGAIGASADRPHVPVFLHVAEVEALDVRSPLPLPEYAELATLTAVISSLQPLGTSPSEVHPRGFAERLFATLHAVHGLPATLSRAGRCSIHIDDITPRGELSDVYYFTDGAQTPDLPRAQTNDLLQAIELLDGVFLAPDGLRAAVEAAIDVYAAHGARMHLERLTAGFAADRSAALSLADGLRRARR
ncbi:hypothetical protein [Streptomyces sp. NEAU-NA10]|uniref:hypothetical protein n=1 Tax=Streptomyces sp. NEAU-NA10 TaxID=3416050 RepID=UPI003CC50744